MANCKVENHTMKNETQSSSIAFAFVPTRWPRLIGAVGYI